MPGVEKIIGFMVKTGFFFVVECRWVGGRWLRENVRGGGGQGDKREENGVEGRWLATGRQCVWT
jgi:hypothetical protein